MNLIEANKYRHFVILAFIKFESGLFASNPLLPADGTAHETSREPG